MPLTLAPGSDSKLSSNLTLNHRDEAFTGFVTHFSLSFQSVCPCTQVNLIFFGPSFSCGHDDLYFFHLIKVPDLET